MKEIADLIRCDVCQKTADKDSAYKLNLKKNESGLTKTTDICHDCIKEKGILDLLAERKWQKWNSKKFKYETPE